MRSVEALEQIGPSAEGPLWSRWAIPTLRSATGCHITRAVGRAHSLAPPNRAERRSRAGRGYIEPAGLGGHPRAADRASPSSLPVVRRAVIKAVCKSHRRDLGPELIRVASADPEPAIRASALEAIRALRAGGSLPVALSGVRDPNTDVRIAAIRLIGESGDGSALDILSGSKRTILIPRFEPLPLPLWSASAAPRQSPSSSDCCAMPIPRYARPRHSRRADLELADWCRPCPSS